MRNATAFIVGLFLAGTASAAGNDFADFQFDGVKAAPDGSAFTITGTCGLASITVSHASRIEGGPSADHYHAGGDAIAHFVAGHASADARAMDSANQVGCVTSPQGKRIVVAEWCTAHCDPVNFEVFDAATLKRLSPAGLDTCTVQCAEKATGARLPAYFLHNDWSPML